MALEAVAVQHETVAAPLPPTRSATISPLRVPTRADTVARRRHERRRWLLIGAVVFGGPVLACLGVLEVVR